MKIQNISMLDSGCFGKANIKQQRAKLHRKIQKLLSFDLCVVLGYFVGSNEGNSVAEF
jgi:hypothetical protein